MAGRIFDDPTWAFPAGTPGLYPEESPLENVKPETHQSSPHQQPPESPQPPKPAKHYPPRTCRICFETVLPTYHPPSPNLPQMLQGSPRVTYESDDPASGRLIRPCKCKGSSRYVHEGCLQQWRHADPSYGTRNYWQCPTCGFKYRLERMSWGRLISSTTTQITLTLSILFLTMFLLGFVADPIINLYVDPYNTLYTGDLLEPITVNDLTAQGEPATWLEHFMKGLASLGMLSFIKVLFALGPLQYWNLRSSGLLGTTVRAQNTGRDRAASISWVVLLIGVGTFLWVGRTLHLVLSSSLTAIGCLERRTRVEPSDSRKSQ